MKLSDKKISLIIPVYNAEQYLKSCLLSCEEQDIPRSDYEIIIINDGSTDKSEKIISEFRNKYNNIILINQPNQGQSVARNNGINSAHGKYIWFIDADDRISKNCLGTIISIMETKQLEVLPTILNTQSVFSKNIKNTHINFLDNPIISGEDFIKNYTPIVVAPWGYIFNRTFWEANSFEFVSHILYEDVQLIPIVISKARRINVPFQRIALYNNIPRQGSTINSSINISKISGFATICKTHLDYSKKIFRNFSRKCLHKCH